MHFLSRTQMIFAVGAAVMLLTVLELVRRRRLSEEYSLLWVVSSIGMTVLGFSTPLLQAITRGLGIRYESSTAFACGVTFGIVMLLYLCTRLTRLGREQHALARELALLRARSRAARERRGDGAGAACETAGAAAARPRGLGRVRLAVDARRRPGQRVERAAPLQLAGFRGCDGADADRLLAARGALASADRVAAAGSAPAACSAPP